MLGIENAEDLVLVGLGVLVDLLASERLACRALAGRVADHPGEIADQEKNLVPEILELAQLVEQDGMPEMQIRRRRIEARLDPQRTAEGQLPAKRIFEEDFVGPALDQRKRTFELLHDVRSSNLVGIG